MSRIKHRNPKEEGSVTDVKKVIADGINEVKLYGSEYVHYPTFVFSKTARKWYTNQNHEDPTLFQEVENIEKIPDMYFDIVEEVKPL